MEVVQPEEKSEKPVAAESVELSEVEKPVEEAVEEPAVAEPVEEPSASEATAPEATEPEAVEETVEGCWGLASYSPLKICNQRRARRHVDGSTTA